MPTKRKRHGLRRSQRNFPYNKFRKNWSQEGSYTFGAIREGLVWKRRVPKGGILIKEGPKN